MQKQKNKFEMKGEYWAFLFIAIVLALYILFPEPQMMISTYGSLVFIIGLGMFSGWASMELYRYKSRTMQTPLGTGKGSVSSLHPDDVRITPYIKGEPSYTVVAQGGFNSEVWSPRGSKRFLVFFTSFGFWMKGAYTCLADLQPVPFDELSDAIQHELNQLKGFNKEKAKAKKNIYLGTTSKYFNMSTPEDIKYSEIIKNQNAQINRLRNELRASYNQRRTPQGNQSWVPIPDDSEFDNE